MEKGQRTTRRDDGDDFVYQRLAYDCIKKSIELMRRICFSISLLILLEFFFLGSIFGILFG